MFRIPVKRLSSRLTFSAASGAMLVLATLSACGGGGGGGGGISQHRICALPADGVRVGRPKRRRAEWPPFPRSALSGSYSSSGEPPCPVPHHHQHPRQLIAAYFRLSSMGFAVGAHNAVRARFLPVISSLSILVHRVVRISHK